MKRKLLKGWFLFCVFMVCFWDGLKESGLAFAMTLAMPFLALWVLITTPWYAFKRVQAMLRSDEDHCKQQRWVMNRWIDNKLGEEK